MSRVVFGALLGVGLASCAGAKEKPAGDSVRAVEAPLPPTVQPVSQWTVTEYGMGPLRADMPFKAASDSLKGALVAAPGANLSECDFVKWRGAPPGVLVMVSEGKIARVDIDSAGVTTREGAGVGSTDAQIRAMYPGRVESSPHKYSDGNYFTVKAVNPADSMFRIIFEIENGKVTRYRAGVMPAVEYVEGCS